MGLVQNGMAEKELRKVFYDQLAVGDVEAKRKAYYRARKWAVEFGFIELAQGVVILLKEFK